MRELPNAYDRLSFTHTVLEFLYHQILFFRADAPFLSKNTNTMKQLLSIFAGLVSEMNILLLLIHPNNHIKQIFLLIFFYILPPPGKDHLSRSGSVKS